MKSTLVLPSKLSQYFGTQQKEDSVSNLAYAPHAQEIFSKLLIRPVGWRLTLKSIVIFQVMIITRTEFLVPIGSALSQIQIAVQLPLNSQLYKVTLDLMTRNT